MAARIKIRKGSPADAGLLAELMNAAGEGIPAYLWAQSAGPQADPIAYGARRVQRDEGAFSYANTHLAVIGDAPAGMLLSYHLPDPYELDAQADVPAIVRPALELEAHVPGSWYVNAVATGAPHRGRGVATALMRHAERLARKAGADRLSLIVAEQNAPARELYRRLGYAPVARRAVVAFPGFPHGGDWVLMGKDLPEAR